MAAGYGYAVDYGGQGVVVAARLGRLEVECEHVPGVVPARSVAGEDEAGVFHAVVPANIARKHGAVLHAVCLLVDYLAVVNGIAVFARKAAVKADA